jgi:hypothetical protein
MLDRRTRQATVRRRGRRKGQVMVLFALMLPVMVGFLALSVGASVELNTRATLDQAALTAAIAASSDACMSSPYAFDVYECNPGSSNYSSIETSPGQLPEPAFTDITAAAAQPAPPADVKTFTTNGTWTSPTPPVGDAAYSSTTVKVIGGGGGGGGGACNSNAAGGIAGGGGGGGGGGYSSGTFSPPAPGSTKTVVVGTAGTAGTGASCNGDGGPGGNGGDSTFGITTAHGGSGGGAGIRGNSYSGSGGAGDTNGGAGGSTSTGASTATGGGAAGGGAGGFSDGWNGGGGGCSNPTGCPLYDGYAGGSRQSGALLGGAGGWTCNWANCQPTNAGDGASGTSNPPQAGAGGGGTNFNGSSAGRGGNYGGGGGGGSGGCGCPNPTCCDGGGGAVGSAGTGAAGIVVVTTTGVSVPATVPTFYPINTQCNTPPTTFCVVVEHDMALYSADTTVRNILAADYPGYTVVLCPGETDHNVSGYLGHGVAPSGGSPTAKAVADPTVSCAGLVTNNTTIVYQNQVSYWYYYDTDDLPASGDTATTDVPSDDLLVGQTLDYPDGGNAVPPDAGDTSTGSSLTCPATSQLGRLVNMQIWTHFNAPFGGVLGINRVAFSATANSYGCGGK